MTLKSLECWDRFLICIPKKSDYDIILTSQDIGLQTSTLSNHIIWHQRGKPLVSQSFRQSRTSHLFITGCAPRALSENKEALFTSIMLDVITHPCHTCVQYACAITSPQYFCDVISRLVDENIPLHHVILAIRVSVAHDIFLCDSLLFECGTIKYWIFVLKFKCISFPRALCLGTSG